MVLRSHSLPEAVHDNFGSQGYYSLMRGMVDSAEIVWANLKQMEAAVSGLKQLRDCIADGLETKNLASIIEKAESQVAEIKRRLVN